MVILCAVRTLNLTASKLYWPHITFPGSKVQETQLLQNGCDAPRYKTWLPNKLHPNSIHWELMVDRTERFSDTSSFYVSLFSGSSLGEVKYFRTKYKHWKWLKYICLSSKLKLRHMMIVMRGMLTLLILYFVFFFQMRDTNLSMLKRVVRLR